MINSISKYKYTIICLIILISFFFVKLVALYFGLYRTDLFCSLQLLRDWVFGKPIYVDNLHGYLLKYHTFFSAPIFAFIAYPLGAYGLVVLLGMVWIVSFLTLRNFLNGITNSTHILWFIFAGPLAFWIIDNQIYGFHIEQLFAPLGLLFTIALIKKAKLSAFILGLIICTLRQEGVVLACVLHLQFIAFEFINKKISTNTFIKKTFAYGASYVALFLLCLIFLGMATNDTIGGERVGFAFSKTILLLQTSFKQAFIYFALLGLRFLLFSAPFFILLAFVNNGKQMIATSIGFLVLIIIHFLAGARYIPDIEFSITWAPRFSSIYGFLCSSIILAYYHHQQSTAAQDSLFSRRFGFPSRGFMPVFICAYLMQFVAYASAYTRFVFAPVLPRIDWHQATPAKILDVINEGESQFARTHHQWGDKFRLVASGLPDFYPIALSNYLHTYFHRHDTFFLPARKFASAWRMPRAVIVDHSDYSGIEIDEMQAILPNSKKHDLGEFTLIVLPEDEKYFSPLIQNPS